MMCPDEDDDCLRVTSRVSVVYSWAASRGGPSADSAMTSLEVEVTGGGHWVEWTLWTLDTDSVNGPERQAASLLLDPSLSRWLRKKYCWTVVESVEDVPVKVNVIHCQL